MLAPATIGYERWYSFRKLFILTVSQSHVCGHVFFDSVECCEMDWNTWPVPIKHSILLHSSITRGANKSTLQEDYIIDTIQLTVSVSIQPLD